MPFDADLSLPEALLLLALHDDDGKVATSASTALPFGLAGATLLELARRGRLRYENEVWTVRDDASCDDTPPGSPALDAALKRIAAADAPEGTMHWLRHLGDAGDGLKTLLLQHLVERGILREDEHRFLWIIPYERYPTDDAVPEHRLRQRIRRVVLEEEPAADHDLAVLALMRACDLTGEVFSAEEQREHVKRLDALTEENRVAAAVSAATDEAVAAVIIAATAATTATS